MFVLILAVVAFALAAYVLSRGCYAVSAGLTLCTAIVCSSATASELSFAAMLPTTSAVTSAPPLDFAAMRSPPIAALPALSFEAMAHRPTPPVPAAPPPQQPKPAIAVPPQVTLNWGYQPSRFVQHQHPMSPFYRCGPNCRRR